ncbi:unnamed protein product [Ambrosiozyma monospora]|uniref:Unnamed protein product n=1 Tax=Ambrosiozyma monospora TaxID=43982 RepID=A0A9W7DDK3_AMBMO|nr:unnamed protein product [Ambrosiozyma monospora]
MSFLAGNIIRQTKRVNLSLPKRLLFTSSRSVSKVSVKSDKKFHAAGVTIATGLALFTTHQTLLNDSNKKKKHRIIIIDDDEDDEEEDDDDDVDDEYEAEKREEKRKEAIANKPPLTSILSINDFEAVAKAVLPLGTWGYYSTGSDDEFSLRENHYAYGRIFFRPKCLVDVSDVSLETTLFGCKFDAPFYITAFAGSPMAHSDAELNLIRGAYKEGIPHMIPYQVSFPLDNFMKEAGEGQENFYQVHFYTEKQLAEAPQFFKGIETKYKNVKAIFINVDLPAIGNREKDQKVRALLDPDAGDALAIFASSTVEYKVITWDDIIRIKNSTNLPIALKGVLRKEDVLKAAEIGLSGCIISNHGGRQLDFAMPPVEILAQSKKLLKEKHMDKDFHIFVDGGIRRGSDIIKALCLGAAGVGLGRPFLYAMAGYGQPGVERAAKILKAEMVRDMKLLGVKSIDELNEDLVDIESLKYKGIQTTDSLYGLNYTEMLAPKFKN